MQSENLVPIIQCVDDGNDSSSKFVADAASVRQQIPIVICTDAGSVGHDLGNLELLNELKPTEPVDPATPGILLRVTCRIPNRSPQLELNH